MDISSLTRTDVAHKIGYYILETGFEIKFGGKYDYERKPHVNLETCGTQLSASFIPEDKYLSLHIVIPKNPKKIISELTDLITDGFEIHGIPKSPLYIHVQDKDIKDLIKIGYIPGKVKIIEY